LGGASGAELPGRYSSTGTRNLILFSSDVAASQESRLVDSGFGGDLRAASAVTVSGSTKSVLE
jgi:hypothetical protein